MKVVYTSESGGSSNVAFTATYWSTFENQAWSSSAARSSGSSDDDDDDYDDYDYDYARLML